MSVLLSSLSLLLPLWLRIGLHDRHMVMSAAVAVPAPPPVGWMGLMNSGDHAMYLRNLHNSGYNPKNDFNAAGTIANQ